MTPIDPNLAEPSAQADEFASTVLNYASRINPGPPSKLPRAILVMGILEIFSIPLALATIRWNLTLTIVALAIGLATANVITALVYFLKFRVPGDRRGRWMIFAGLFLSTLAIVILIKIVLDLADFRNALLNA